MTILTLPGVPACAGDPELFFAPEGEPGGARGVREMAAKAICAGCPARAECRAYAMADPRLVGMWGGTTEDDRANERRRRTHKGHAARRLAALLAAGEKPCTRCGETKPLAAFSRAGRGDGFASRCRDCVNECRRAAAA